MDNTEVIFAHYSFPFKRDKLILDFNFRLKHIFLCISISIQVSRSPNSIKWPLLICSLTSHSHLNPFNKFAGVWIQHLHKEGTLTFCSSAAPTELAALLRYQSSQRSQCSLRDPSPLSAGAAYSNEPNVRSRLALIQES